MYYQHKKYQIERAKLNTINELFAKYDLADLGRISPKDARALLRQIGIDQEHALELVLKSDLQHRGSIRKEILLETIREYWGSKKSQKEIELVFDAIRPKNQENQQDEITIDDIRAVAKRLGESLTETDLREMFDFADPQKTGTVTFKEFQTIMKKTAIW